MILRASERSRHRHLAQSLGTALVAHGELETAAAGGAFPDVPLWVGRDHVYFAGKSEVEVQSIAQLLWAYAEKFYTLGLPGYTFGLRARYQLVLWNRDAVATVLPVRKRFLDASLNCIRQGAPWMPVGYTVAMAESWNTDHADLLALIASHREGGRRFEPWASSDIAMVLSESRAGALEIYVQT
jgi:hypothetical protein